MNVIRWYALWVMMLVCVAEWVGLDGCQRVFAQKNFQKTVQVYLVYKCRQAVGIMYYAGGRERAYTDDFELTPSEWGYAFNTASVKGKKVADTYGDSALMSVDFEAVGDTLFLCYNGRRRTSRPMDDYLRREFCR
jgi:hypothetical protein